MKQISFTSFAVIFGLMAIAFTAPAQAVVTCGVPGTEGLPTCNTVSDSKQACCVPPYYKGVKTVTTPGTKATANKVSHVPTKWSNATVTTTVNNNTPADFIPSPVNNKTASVHQATVAQTAPAQTAPTPAAPSVASVSVTPAASAAPALSAGSASAVKSASASSSAKTAK